MALTPPANTDLATTQHLDRVEERMAAAMTALEERITAATRLGEARGETQHAEIATRIAEVATRIETSALRTRLWTFGAVIAAQVASLTYLTDTLG